MLTSTEIRRFQKGMIPHELLKTFEGSYPPEDRTDYYLDILTQDNLSIKVRGVDESRIEFKQRLEEGTSVSANGLTGTIESWCFCQGNYVPIYNRIMCHSQLSTYSLIF